jgi:hypothetical protein
MHRERSTFGNAINLRQLFGQWREVEEAPLTEKRVGNRGR